MEILQPPTGIHDSMKNWVAATHNHSTSNAIITDIYPTSAFSRRIPRPPAHYPIVLEGGTVGVIPNGRIIGLNGAVVTPDHYLLWDVSLEYVHPRNLHSIFQKESLPQISQYVERATDLTHVVGRNYYHWMYEVLPRIHLLKKSNITTGHYVVKSEPDDLPFQTETMGYLGISAEQLIKTHEDFHLIAENLVVPSQPSFATKWSFDFLRKTFLTDKLKSVDKKRIYIRRKWARRITNEAELMVILEHFGFEAVELETLSIAEQIQLFSSAGAIIAPHGAGLTNLTFCQPGTVVIEIFSPTYITSLYWVISSFGNLRHYYFLGSYGGQDPDYSDPDWTGKDNITINMSKFIVLLKSLRI